MRSRFSIFRPTSLRTRMSLLFGSSALVLVLLVTGLNSGTLLRQWQDNNDAAARAASVRVEETVNTDFECRLANLSQLAIHIFNQQTDDHVQHSLELLHGMHADYSWVSLTNEQGQIVASTNKQVLGVDVSQQTWFRAIKRVINTQTDEKRGMVSSRLVNETQIAFDFSVPVYDVKGRFIGAIVAELLSDRLQGVIDRVIAQEPASNFDGLLIDGNGMILSGSMNLIGHRVEVEANENEPSVIDPLGLNFSTVKISNGKAFSTVVPPTNPSHLLARLGWRVLLLVHPSSLGMLWDQIFPTVVAGGGLGLFFVAACYVLAARSISPFIEVVQAANKLRDRGEADGNGATAAAAQRGGDKRLSLVTNSPYSEVVMLSTSINTLMSGLTANREDMHALNESLNHKVKERTLELVLIADSLQNEIAQRERLQQQHEQLMAELLALASTDSLTKAFNRRTLYQLGEEEFSRARRMNLPIAVIMLDIDRFKHINDSFGHAAGDEILEKVAEQFRGVVRESDIIGRYGGEEFVFVLPGTDEEGALLVAERLRKSVIEAGEQTTIADRWQITASLGVAALNGETRDFAALIRRADDAVYDAKHAGRNRIAIAP